MQIIDKIEDIEDIFKYFSGYPMGKKPTNKGIHRRFRGYRGYRKNPISTMENMENILFFLSGLYGEKNIFSVSVFKMRLFLIFSLRN